jgi:hypothetical protein
MPDPIYYALDENNNRIQTLSKEEILSAIAQAQEAASVLDYEGAFITKIRELNANKDLQFWIGTQAEYNAISPKAKNVLYIISDDNHKEEIIEGIENIAAGLANETARRAADDNALSARISVIEGQNLDTRIQNLGSALSAHTSNADIHLTAAEKAFLTRPFMSYSYFGTGQTEREIALNDPQGNPYNPDIVIVSASGLPTSGLGSGIVKNYTAFGARMPNDTLCTAGLEFTSTGIKVYNNNALADGAKQFLNETGTDYLIIAIKIVS